MTFKTRTITARLNEQCRVVIPREVRSALGVTAGDEIIFQVTDGLITITSPSALRRAVWANNRGDGSGDSTADIREERLADQEVEAASQRAMDGEEPVIERGEGDAKRFTAAQVMAARLSARRAAQGLGPQPSPRTKAILAAAEGIEPADALAWFDEQQSSGDQRWPSGNLWRRRPPAGE